MILPLGKARNGCDEEEDDDDGDLRDGNDDEDINEEAGKLGGWRMMWWK